MKFGAGLIVLQASIFVFILPDSEALTCYSCTFCSNPFDASSASQIDSILGKACKTCVAYKSDAGSIRTCLPADVGVDGCVDGSDYGQKGEACFCNTNLCNGATSHEFLPATIACVLLTLFKQVIW